MPVRAWLLPPEPEAIAQMAPEELDNLRRLGFGDEDSLRPGA